MNSYPFGFLCPELKDFIDERRKILSYCQELIGQYYFQIIHAKDKGFQYYMKIEDLCMEDLANNYLCNISCTELRYMVYT